MIVTTGNDVPGKKVTEVLGVVRGSTVRARNIGRDIGAGFKNIIGGEVKTYTEMTKNARDEAYNRMVNEAIDKKADAIIGVRFMTSMVMQGASEMLAYGTAVKLGKWFFFYHGPKNALKISSFRFFKYYTISWSWNVYIRCKDLTKFL